MMDSDTWFALGNADSGLRASPCPSHSQFERPGPDVSSASKSNVPPAELWAEIVELRISNRRFEAAISNMAHGLTMLDKDQRLIVGNRRFAELYALPPELLMPGTLLSDLIGHSIARGVFANAGILKAMQTTLNRMHVNEVAQRHFKLSNGRVIRCTVTRLPDEGCVLLHEDVTEKRRAQWQVVESEQRFRDFVSSASDWCWETDAEHRFTFISDAMKALLGVDPTACIGLKRTEFAPIFEDQAASEAHLADFLALKPFTDTLLRFSAPDGTIRWIKSSGSPRFDRNGHFLGYRGISRDVTLEEERRQALEKAQVQLQDRAARLTEAQQIGRLGDWSYREGDSELWWSQEIFDILGCDPAEFRPTTEAVVARYVGDSFARLRESQAKLADSSAVATVDVQAFRADGTICDLAVTSKTLIEDGRVVGRYGTIQDITERKQAERRLEQLAYFDPLTGLANRSLFKQELSALIDRSSERGVEGALLLIDLDRFKEVNDSLGHAAGDELLIKVGQLLHQILGERAFVARLGGDEFGILVEPSSNDDFAERVAAELVGELSRSVTLASGEVFVGATIGVTCVPKHGATCDEALRNADLALYRAKEAGRGRSLSFEPRYAREVEERHELGQLLRHAIDAGELRLHYQPQVDLRTWQVKGFEALARWHHPERGVISPATFIPIAESSGLIVKLGTWALREGCRQARAWLDAGLPPRSVSVNVSVAQLWSLDFEAAVAGILSETGLPADLLCLEVTENLFLDHTEKRANATLRALADMGVRLALDDFGTGYSSLGYLTRLPFQCLKVDRSFVAGISADGNKRRLLKGIIALASGLRMDVVAEGAETHAEVRILQDLGCDCVQGFYFARPSPGAEAIAFAERLEGRMIGDAASLIPSQGKWLSVQGSGVNADTTGSGPTR
jgi:diguanylate cyclase (GGDEF)-like protein/PAS domain S-box-containing protein